MDKILLRNITSEGRQTDITIADGLIKRITPHSDEYQEPASGVETIDCTGKVAVPGFINMHTRRHVPYEGCRRGYGPSGLAEAHLGH